MSVLIIRLNGATEEEAAEVRELLEQHDLAFYETTAGRWGVSVAGLWLQDESQKHRAQALIEQYQNERKQRYQQWWDEQPSILVSLWRNFLSRPVAFVMTAALVIAIVYISIAPFFI